MPRAVQRRKMISFSAHFGPPALVWVAGAYLLYRATQLNGSSSERSFGIGLLLIICASITGSARRSRQTTTRERALEIQIHNLTQRVRVVEDKVDGVIMDLDTDNAAHALGEAVRRHSGQKPPWMRLVTKENSKGR